MAVYHFDTFFFSLQSISNGLNFFKLHYCLKPQIFKFPKMHSNGTHDFTIVKKLRRCEKNRFTTDSFFFFFSFILLLLHSIALYVFLYDVAKPYFSHSTSNLSWLLITTGSSNSCPYLGPLRSNHRRLSWL